MAQNTYHDIRIPQDNQCVIIPLKNQALVEYAIHKLISKLSLLQI